ncbi:thermonuclease family protein [Rhizobium sp. TRM96647]|uniref:thermonuclease family protein n=1 Tax=unclassified Rhizobium TaxID=2613769 RepID=UPI001E2CB1A6|nr:MULTISPECIES: thermonuclease family protein [unclassified Rhizobium]MCD2184562.1 thermonuclease family protein [Rhizobium sp. GN54]MCV3737692.1 thermonuclease family protein [Rhizobium sp. TRM96647]MCV3759577.1 thermonuclease family protein [Rhizobium sp. TRM96650]
MLGSGFVYRRKWADLAVTAAILSLMALIALRLDDRPATELFAGAARAADGDTLTLDGRRIRLSGMDAPELTQVCRREEAEWYCGASARSHLAEMLRRGDIACSLIGTDKYNRTLARCRIGEEDVGERMVRDGLAVSYGDYEEAESLARQERKGLWSSVFDRPQDWRRQHGRPQEEPHVPVETYLGAFLRFLGLG